MPGGRLSHRIGQVKRTPTDERTLIDMPKHKLNIAKIVIIFAIIGFAVVVVTGASMVQAADKDPELAMAAQVGDLNEVIRLLNQGTDVNAKANFGNTALMAAALEDHVDVVKALLDKGADVNAKNKNGSTALMAASVHYRVDMVKALLNKGADVNAKNEDGGTALGEALEYGNAEVVKLLKAHGASASADQNRELAMAAQVGDLNEVIRLLNQGADVNAKANFGRTALMAASVHCHVDVVKALLDKGADVNAKDEDGGTALGEALEYGNAQVVKLLKAHGASVSGDQNRELAMAAQVGDLNEVIRLLNQGTDVNARANFGLTALMAAALEGHVDVVKALLDKGADVNAKDKYGRKALMMALEKRHLEVAKTLLHRGADVNATINHYSWSPLMNVLPFRGRGREWEENILEVVRIMLDKGADVNAKAGDGMTALMSAALEDQVDVVVFQIKLPDVF